MLRKHKTTMKCQRNQDELSQWGPGPFTSLQFLSALLCDLDTHHFISILKIFNRILLPFLRLGSAYGPQDANIGNGWKHFKCYPFTSFMAPITICDFSLHLWFTFVLLFHLLYLKYTPCWDGTVCSAPYPQPLTDHTYLLNEWVLMQWVNLHAHCQGWRD